MAIWTVETTTKLIEMFEERPNLYNIKEKSYHNRDLRSKSLGEIATALHIPGTCTTHYKTVQLCVYLFTVDEVEKKIKNMRSQYNRERGKKRKSKTGQGLEDVYEPKWIYFKSLQFLDDFVTARQSQSNLQVIKSCYFARAQSH